MLRKETVSIDCLKLLKELMAMQELQQFRLAGGTALSLQLGHRLSVDLDVFTDQSFDVAAMEIVLRQHFPSFEKEIEKKIAAHKKPKKN